MQDNKMDDDQLGTKQCYDYPSLQSDITKKMQSLCDDSTNQSLCDATFQIGKNKSKFNIVTTLFAIHSTDLKNLIKRNNNKLIIVQDITPESFQFLRHYFYGLNPNITLNNVSDVIYAADKFKINSLLDVFNKYISEIKTIDNLISIVSSLHARKLHHVCNQLISSNKLLQNATVFSSGNFKRLPAELLINLLKRDDSSMSEEAIFEKCVIWAKHQVEIDKINMNKCEYDEGKLEETSSLELGGWKHVIQPLLPFIRFPIMNGEYFAANVVDMKILSSDDCTLIMQYMFTQKENKALTYSTKLRYKFEFDICYDNKHITNNGHELKISENVRRIYGCRKSFNSGIHKFTIKCVASGESTDDGIGIMTEVKPCMDESIWFDDKRVVKAFTWAQYGKLWKFNPTGTGRTALVRDITVWNTGDLIALEVDCDNWKIKCFLNETMIAAVEIDQEKKYFFAMAIRDVTAHYKLVRHQIRY